MLETERGGHARDVVQSLSLAELQSYDGLIAVRSLPACAPLKCSVQHCTCSLSRLLKHSYSLPGVALRSKSLCPAMRRWAGTACFRRY